MTIVFTKQCMVVNNDEQTVKIKIWCKENLINFGFYTEHRYGHYCIFKFDNEEDLMAVKLRWL